MTDMRATERLLEVIEESVLKDPTTGLGIAIRQHEEKHRYGPTSTLDDLVAVVAEVIAFEHGRILDAITELRRRGDTLVRRDDLRAVIEYSQSTDDQVLLGDRRIRILDAMSRIETQIGGTL